MDEINQLVVVYVATAHLLLSMMAATIESRKRKCLAHTSIGQINYGPIEDRDRSRIDYLNNKIWKNDIICINMLRLTKGSFIHFCDLIRERGLLQDTVHMCVELQVAMFLHIIGHNVKNRVVDTKFSRSSETVSRYFNKDLHTIGELCNDFIRPPSSTTPAKILGNTRWDPYFKEVALFLTMLILMVVFALGLIYCHCNGQPGLY
jgi:hypothetical protein